MKWCEAADPARAYAAMLLARHGIDAELPESGAARSTAADWADSGAMALTGTPDGPPRLVEGAPATTMRGALIALAALATTAGLDASALPDHRVLSERAAAMALRRAGDRSAGGATRLFPAADGLVAATLSRVQDIDALPALTSRDVDAADPWRDLATWVAENPADDVVERATLLGLAASAVDTTLPVQDVAPTTSPTSPAPLGSPLRVVDLSALWAGPLCAHLLGRVGAQVTVVESATRRDPTREVAPQFHQLLRGGTDLVVLDLGTAEGIARLTDLVTQADVVIEASRPRALLQLGIDPPEIVAAAKACTWISVTAYGRAHNRIGYGDDVAAGAGLLGTSHGHAGPVFAGDAIADPLTGAHAAVAALTGVLTGQSAVVEVAMYDVARAARTPVPSADVVERDGSWYVDDGDRLTAVRSPALRTGA